jgi:hypothetical protein
VNASSDGRRIDMRRTFGIGLALVAIAAGVIIGVGAYHAGYTHGVTNAAAAGGRVVRVVGPRFYGPGFGFFPFGFLFFPLFLIGIFLLIRALAWRRWDGGGPGWRHHHGYGGGPGDRGAMYEDWHRRQHEQMAGATSERGQPSSA